MSIRLTIVDSQVLVRYGLRALLSEQPDTEIVAECASAAEAARVVATERPDVVTLDTPSRTGTACGWPGSSASGTPAWAS
jgi:DNA-binding NarL/FixJ family response regulator